jgi:hypothetical protein
MNSNLKTVLIVIALLSAPYAVRYAIDAVQTKEQVRQIEQRADDPTSESVIDPVAAKEEWMSSCDDGTLNGANFSQTTYCGCTFDLIVQEKGLNWVANIGLNGTEAEIKAAIEPFANRCLDQQNVETI